MLVSAGVQVKFDASDLAKIAMELEVPVVHLRKLRDITRKGSASDIEEYVQSHLKSGLVLPEFGNELLRLNKKYASNKEDFLNLLQYTAFELLYLYSSSTRAMDP